jgi:hypothetical protein
MAAEWRPKTGASGCGASPRMLAEDARAGYAGRRPEVPPAAIRPPASAPLSHVRQIG